MKQNLDSSILQEGLIIILPATLSTNQIQSCENTCQQMTNNNRQHVTNGRIFLFLNNIQVSSHTTTTQWCYDRFQFSLLKNVLSLAQHGITPDRCTPAWYRQQCTITYEWGNLPTLWEHNDPSPVGRPFRPQIKLGVHLLGDPTSMASNPIPFPRNCA